MEKVVSIEMKPSDNSNIIQDFVNGLFANKKPPINAEPKNREEMELLNSLHEAKKQLDIANMNFEFAQDNELIDSFIYEIKAAETRYQYLLKMAKRKNVNVANYQNTHITNKDKKCF
ncbi:YaaL family protein [Petroclostridium sp. X23]|uniref:YaaL family protein n=1 Tax=Petroclostridium sp. X23 TaxID=3045146 RepID=UPI0024AE4A8C|nr:YaaL family protein [Petroclostridium sp. X23]WHH57106.1 YaaL family protein [Petroclostridium sp. X23]